MGENIIVSRLGRRIFFFFNFLMLHKRNVKDERLETRLWTDAIPFLTTDRVALCVPWLRRAEEKEEECEIFIDIGCCVRPNPRVISNTPAKCISLMNAVGSKAEIPLLYRQMWESLRVYCESILTNYCWMTLHTSCLLSADGKHLHV